MLKKVLFGLRQSMPVLIVSMDKKHRKQNTAPKSSYRRNMIEPGLVNSLMFKALTQYHNCFVAMA